MTRRAKTPWTGDRCVQVISVVCSDMWVDSSFALPTYSFISLIHSKRFILPLFLLLPIFQYPRTQLQKPQKGEEARRDMDDWHWCATVLSSLKQYVPPRLRNLSIRLSNVALPLSLCLCPYSGSQDPRYKSSRSDKKRHKRMGSR